MRNKTTLKLMEAGKPKSLRHSLGEYKFEEQVGYLLRRAYQRHTAIFQRLCPDPQLTQVQLAVLCAAYERGESSLTEIGRSAAIDPATTRGIVERLQERELVALVPSKSDKRKVMVVIQRAGRQLLKDVVADAAQITRQTLSSLNPAEQVALLFLLKKLFEADNFGAED